MRRPYSQPVISSHGNDVTKDWYVFFQYRHEGKTYKIKKREGVNRIKNERQKVKAINELHREILLDLQNGWNPILDRKREYNYNPYLYEKANLLKKQKANKQGESFKKQLFEKLLNSKGH